VAIGSAASADSNGPAMARAAGGERSVRRHLVIGWTGLLVFLTMGLGLETLHGLKLDLYLDVRHHTRRLMWTLAHAHGTLFSIVHLGFAATVGLWGRPAGFALNLASACLTGALIALPLGFFLGGAWLHAGDPGLGILLVPFGGGLLLVAVAVTGWSVIRSERASGRPPASASVSAGPPERPGTGRSARRRK
jgi:hypothetical protein